MKRNLMTLAFALLLTAANSAFASLIISGGNCGTDNLTINTSTYNATLSGCFGGNLYTDSNTTLKFVFLGKEASYWDSLIATNNDNSESITMSNQDPAGTTYVLHGVLAGLINFVINVANTNTSVANGDNTPNSSPGFWLGSDGNGNVIIGVDDGGAGPDGDYNDLVGKISAVPEPSSLALISLSLLGAGLVALRSRKSRGNH